MEFGIALPWQIVKSIRSWFTSSIDNDCAKYGVIKKINLEIDAMKIKKKGVNHNGGYILT